MYQFILNLFQSFLSLFRKEKEEKEYMPLNLQFFAADEESDDDQDDDGSDEDEGEDDSPSLDELLKDKKFKKQYQAKLKEQLAKRLKKFDGIDPEEFRRLKEQAEKKDDSEDKDKDSDETAKRLLRAERREKQALVKEFAAENGHSPKLLARLIDIDQIELDEDGNAENLEDLFEELEEEFPEYFGQQDEEEEDKDTKKDREGYRPGPKQKGNPPKKKDKYELGKSAYQRIRGKNNKEG